MNNDTPRSTRCSSSMPLSLHPPDPTRFTTYINAAEPDRRRPDQGGAALAAFRTRHLPLGDFDPLLSPPVLL
jgi:hypothetical protein